MALAEILLELPQEVLDDDYWGDLIHNVGPFIITDKGIYTDFFGSEMFLPYEFTYDTPHRIVRRIIPVTDADTGDRQTRHLCTTICDLFDYEYNINENISLFKVEKFYDYEKEFCETVNYVRNYLKTKGK